MPIILFIGIIILQVSHISAMDSIRAIAEELGGEIPTYVASKYERINQRGMATEFCEWIRKYKAAGLSISWKENFSELRRKGSDLGDSLGIEIKVPIESESVKLDAKFDPSAPLARAAWDGDLEMCRSLIKGGALANNHFALFCAAIANHKDIFLLLAHNGAEITCFWPFQLAGGGVLLPGMPAGANLLQVAVLAKSWDVLEYLSALEASIDLFSRCEMGDTTLHLAIADWAPILVSPGTSPEMVREHIENSFPGREYKEKEIVKLLLKKGMNPFLQNFFLETPLHVAVELRKPEIAERLLRGAILFKFRKNSHESYKRIICILCVFNRLRKVGVPIPKNNVHLILASDEDLLADLLYSFVGRCKHRFEIMGGFARLVGAAQAKTTLRSCIKCCLEEFLLIENWYDQTAYDLASLDQKRNDYMLELVNPNIAEYQIRRMALWFEGIKVAD